MKNLSENMLFAEICAFYIQFGKLLKLQVPYFTELQQWLSSVGTEAADGLRRMHIELLRKQYLEANPDNWQTLLVAFYQSSCTKNAEQIANSGYEKLDLAMRLRILRDLQDVLFDCNRVLLKNIKHFSAKIRLQLVGRDRYNQRYLMQLPEEGKRYVIYRELKRKRPREPIIRQDLADSRLQVLQLVQQLNSNGITNRTNADAARDHQQLVTFLNMLAFSVFK